MAKILDALANASFSATAAPVRACSRWIWTLSAIIGGRRTAPTCWSCRAPTSCAKFIAAISRPARIASRPTRSARSRSRSANLTGWPTGVRDQQDRGRTRARDGRRIQGRRERYVIGSIGRYQVAVTRPRCHDPLEAALTIQARGLIAGGVDCILIETTQDPLQIKSRGQRIQDRARGSQNGHADFRCR